MTVDHILHDDPGEPIHICFTRCNGAMAFQEARDFASVVDGIRNKPSMIRIKRQLDEQTGRFELLGHYYPMITGSKAWLEELATPQQIERIWCDVDLLAQIRNRP